MLKTTGSCNYVFSVGFPTKISCDRDTFFANLRLSYAFLQMHVVAVTHHAALFVVISLFYDAGRLIPGKRCDTGLSCHCTGTPGLVRRRFGEFDLRLVRRRFGEFRRV
jgi:hypothetical protein